MADTSTTSIIVPAFHEGEGIADVVSALVTAGPWHEIIVVDDPTYLTRRRIPDLTSGFRAAGRAVLVEFLHLIPNGFSTPTTTTLACIKAGYSVEFVPIQAGRRQGTSKIKFAKDGAKFFLIIVKIVTFFSPLRVFLPVSLACFSVGALYAAWTIATQSHLTNSSVLLIVVSVVIFLMGLVSEQIAALRFEGRR